MNRPVLRFSRFSRARFLGALGCAAAVAVSAQSPRPEAAMAAAARKFLGTLDAAQRSRAALPFESEERRNWGFVPSELLPAKLRRGLPLKEMNPTQRQAALELLRAGLSQKGNQKVTLIRQLEDVLKAREMGRGPIRDAEAYFFTVFGEPADGGTWGWRYEGHHCAQNWTVVHGRNRPSVASTPQFFGSNPGEVQEGPMKGTRALAGEEDLGRALVTSLTEEQKKEAILSPTAPSDILTKADRVAAIQEDRGIAWSRLTKDQQGRLTALIQEYADAMPRMLAEQRLAAIRKAGLERIKFAWMGGLEKGQGHYYRVQGSTFLIEYDNTQNNANHVHSVWRDFKGDFGLDLLAMHYRAVPHRVAALPPR